MSSAPHHFTYAVLYPSDQTPDEEYTPIVPLEISRELDATFPHGMEGSMRSALPGIWYALHLPRTAFDYREVSGSGILQTHDLDMPQRVLLAPFPMAATKEMRALFEARKPDIILCAAEQLSAVNEFALQLQGVLDVCSYEQLGETELAAHWRMLSTRAECVDEGFDEAVPFFGDTRTATTLIPLSFVARRLGRENSLSAPEATHAPTMAALMIHVELRAAARIQDDGVAPDEPLDMHQRLSDAKAELAVPVCLLAPGIPRKYRKEAFRDPAPFRYSRFPFDWATVGNESENGIAEEAALRWIVAHRAAAHDGIPYCMPSIPDELWVALAQLEQGYEKAKPSKVNRLLRRLGQKIGGLFDSDAIEVIHSASHIIAFTNFPIGLARLPGATAPLSCLRPVTYRPLLPLTRTIPQEGLSQGTCYWGRGFRLLIAECLEDNDPIRPLSEVAWRIVESHANELSGVECRLFFPRAAEDLRDAISDFEPQAIVISAHGFYRRERNLAGLVIGGRPVIGPELGRVPPVVFLSACHAGPRGIGAMTVTDLLVRQGAWAVLTTQVPVDVRHNSILMTRLLTNIRATIEGELPLRSLLDVWHHTASGNAFNDILHSCDRLRRWSRATNPTSGLPVLQDFMLNKSPGRIRLAHTYVDSERLLLEIAREMNFQKKLRAILKSQGYAPETLLYHFVGWPERVLLRHDAIEATRPP